ncbi:oligosaccharide flippase family protein [Fibrobacter sp. UWB11]|uniref:oligosaccharide flippase family protein n=1 Tax=Fibrobacter sp. UWB11 TaxID=1896202 RepID=UPI0020C95DBA|nr:oligosaccharide flippase family protein [Fibrobacter sp. UWB11]
MLARIFGTGEFGIFVSTQGLLLTIARASTLGLDIGLRWYLPQNKLHKRPVYNGIMESFWISVAVSLFVTVVIILGSFTSLISDELPYYAISLVFYSGMYVLSSSSEGNRKPWISIFINDFVIAVMAPLVSIVLHYFDIPHALPFGLLFGQVIGFTLHAKAVRKQFKNMPLVPPGLASKELVLYSAPLGLTVLVGNLLQRSTLWMVLFFLGAEASGVYALMMTLANGLQTIRNGFNPIITPVVSGMDESRLKTDLKPVYSYCVSMATMIQVIIGFFIVLFPEEIMSIAGKSYVVQPMALGILLFFQLVVTFFGMVNTVIDGIGKSVVNLKASIIQLVTSVVAGFVLIPHLGLLGAALSMLLYGIVSSVYCNVYLLKRKLQPYSSKLWAEIVWMVLLLALYVLINAQVVTLTMVGKIVVYVCVLLALGAQFLFYKRKF